MTTSTSPPTNQAPERAPLRLRMAVQTGRNRIDGGWWPQSRDLAVEVADLVDHFPEGLGDITRAVFSPPDWDRSERRVPVARGVLRLGSFPRDDTHLMCLIMTDMRILRVLVVPPVFTQSQGEEALLAASTRGNQHPAQELLDLVTDNHDADVDDHWNDDGGHWWGDDQAPSYRAG